MDMIELGKRIRLVRIHILKMNQKELAAELNSFQALISRLEKGIGGSLELVLDFVSLLERKGLNGHMLFGKKFLIEQLSGNAKSPKQPVPNKAVAEKFAALKSTIEKGYEQINEIDGLFEFKDSSTKKNVK